LPSALALSVIAESDLVSSVRIDYTGLMKTTSVTAAKSQLSALLKRVESGETILILHRGRPIARLEPARAAEDVIDEERLTRLERSGIIRRASEPPDPTLLDGAAPSLPEESSLLRALLEEREEGQ